MTNHIQPTSQGPIKHMLLLFIGNYPLKQKTRVKIAITGFCFLIFFWVISDE